MQFSEDVNHQIRSSKSALFLLLVAAAWLSMTSAEAQGFTLESAGARFGFGTGSRHDFHQAEAFVDWNLPWRWDLGRDWNLATRLDLSAGWLGGSSRHAAIGTLGPTLVLSQGHFPLSLEAGSSPTLVSRSDFGVKDFGTVFQFTSHVGLNCDLAQHFRLGYRFQHMSNAGLSSHNPGLNLHVFGLSYLF